MNAWILATAVGIIKNLININSDIIYIQGETDSQHQQPMEYAVVDDSKKKGDKQQNVST